MTKPASAAAFAFLMFAAAALAQHAPPQVQWWSKEDAGKRLANLAQPWVQVFALPTLTVGRYRLGKGSSDTQQPHTRDEVYHVLAGSAKLQAGNETRAVAAGDTIFVAAQVPHRFLDIEADLDALVFFAAARPATGGMAAFPAPTEQTPFPETSQRGNARIFYWFGPDSAGQLAIDHGRPRWQPSHGKFVEQPTGRRWRLGENFWTTLDTNMGLTLGGVEVAIGQYYCALVHTKGAGLQLVLLDPTEVRKRRLDAFEADKTTGGILIPLQLTKSDSPAPELEIELRVDPAAKDAGTLSIRFGPYTLTAPLRMHPHR